MSILGKMPRIDTIQLQGEISIEDIRGLCECLKRDLRTIHIVKSIPPSDKNVSYFLKHLEDRMDGFILDSGWFGGSGKIHNWAKSAEIVKTSTKHIILAGGLNAENIKKAIRIVQPYGIDVESGVEDIIINKLGEKAKVKNVIKIKNLVEVVRECKYE